MDGVGGEAARNPFCGVCELTKPSESTEHCPLRSGAHMILGVNHQVENQPKEDMGRTTTAEQLWVDTIFSVERHRQIGNPVGRTPKFSDT